MKTNLIILASLAVASGLRAQTSAAYDTGQGFVVHEWGTFTTLNTTWGAQLAGLHVEEEALPAFAYNLCNCYRKQGTSKGIYTTETATVANVTVKMETPVLYFYNPGSEPFEVSADVTFNGGSVSQWYPNGATKEGYMPKIGYLETYVKDFAVPTTGGLKWTAEVAGHLAEKPFTDKKEDETEQWIAPRATASDFVTVKNLIDPFWDTVSQSYQWSTTYETEKFLFYRGIGNFNPGLRAEFNTNGNLVLTNRTGSRIPFVLIYERTAAGQESAWLLGDLDVSRRSVFAYPKRGNGITLETALKQFHEALVQAGLYDDEGQAMLETWRRSYFGKPGFKIFWILPPAQTETILPLAISPCPRSIKRVLVGRIEMTTLEFEKEINAMDDEEFTKRFSGDRFFAAFQDLKWHATPCQLTQFDSLPVQPLSQVKQAGNESIVVFPNPVSGKVHITTGIDTGACSLVILNDLGNVVFKMSFTGRSCVLDTDEIGPGVYFLHAILPGKVEVVKKVVKN